MVDRYDAIVLAGGGGTRLGGLDKADLRIGGQTLLDRVLAACRDAGQVVLVGPPRKSITGVLLTSEEPPGGGPVAAIAAGLELVQATVVAVLSCDLPFVAPATVQTLVDQLYDAGEAEADGAQALDESGRAQPLLAAYRADRLRDAIAAEAAVHGGPAGLAIRTVVARLAMLDEEVEAGQAWDCDTWPDVRRARARVERHPGEEQ